MSKGIAMAPTLTEDWLHEFKDDHRYDICRDHDMTPHYKNSLWARKLKKHGYKSRVIKDTSLEPYRVSATKGNVRAILPVIGKRALNFDHYIIERKVGKKWCIIQSHDSKTHIDDVLEQLQLEADSPVTGPIHSFTGDRIRYDTANTARRTSILASARVTNIMAVTSDGILTSQISDPRHKVFYLMNIRGDFAPACRIITDGDKWGEVFGNNAVSRQIEPPLSQMNTDDRWLIREAVKMYSREIG